jgi:uncharacterized protein (TIGR03435 family)
MLELLGNHLWQSTLVAAAIGVAVRSCRGNPAGVRYALWVTASLKFLVPFALLTWCGAQLGWLTPESVAPARSTWLGTVGQPFWIAAVQPVPATQMPATGGAPWWPIVAFSIWLSGFGVVAATWLARWRRVSVLASRAMPLNDGRAHDALRRLASAAALRTPVSVALSSGSFEPGVFGIYRPVLLWPSAIDDRLDDPQVEAIIAHEVAHVRRRDNLTAMLHMVVQAIFWFHPLVWWIGRRLVDERERACDEAVIRSGNRPEVYADGLLRTCRFCVESPLACVAGISGSDLRTRVTTILQGAPARPLSAWRTTVLAAAATLSVATPLVSGAVARASEQRREVPAGLRFETASVKRADPNERGRVFGATMHTGRLRMVNLTLTAIIRAAYGIEFPHAIPEERMSGGPGWMASDRFTIEATAGRAVAPAEMASMLRSLLVDRFKLVVRVEQRQQPVFHLIQVAPGRLGPSLRESDVECATAARCGIGGGAGRFLLSSSPMSLLAESLTELTGRPVFDRSGLDGTFDGVLQWSPAPEELLHVGGADPNAAPQAPEPGASLYTALQEQFGLRLVSMRGPVDYLVVESASPPSEN